MLAPLFTRSETKQKKSLKIPREAQSEGVPEIELSMLGAHTRMNYRLVVMRKFWPG